MLLMNRVSSQGGAGASQAGVRDATSGQAVNTLEFDELRGCTAIQLDATGFFRVAQIEGRWWLVTPKGHPFFSTGINALRFQGTATAAGRRHYQDAAERKYGTQEAWAKAQVGRCLSWGWNTVGAWSDWQCFRDRMPYTVLLSVGGYDWNSGPWSDCFSPGFRSAVRERIREVTEDTKDDPYLIGYFLANEMKWGPDHRGGHLLDEFFAKPIEAGAGKAALMRFLQSRYDSLDQLAVDFATTAKSWEELAAGTVLRSRNTTGALATQFDWAAKVAEAYFSTTAQELRAADANHLNLGARFIAHFTPRRVIAEAGKYVDVMSINFYGMISPIGSLLQRFSADYLSVADFLREHYEAGGRPILISEWSYRANDAGLPNTWPPVYRTLPTQEARADAYEQYFRQVLARPWFVGQHWFLFTDQPAEGRFDGENNNFGLVNEQDEPYRILTARSADMHNTVYERLFVGSKKCLIQTLQDR